MPGPAERRTSIHNQCRAFPGAAIAVFLVASAIAPASGSVHQWRLEAGSSPDPIGARVEAGGPVAGECGHLPVEPQLVVDYERGDYPHTLTFGTLGSGLDTTLEITAPVNEVLCDDVGGGGGDALITINDPLSGRYEVRVGTSSSDAVGEDAVVYVHERNGFSADIPAVCHDWNSEGFFVGLTAREVLRCLDAGADPNARGIHDQTPLHLAAMESEDPVVVPLLLAMGADPNARNDFGVTPLHWAAGADMSPAVQALLEAGADPNAWDGYGIAPLHLAAGVGTSAEVVQLLLDAGADPNDRAYLGMTALHWAVKDGTIPEIVHLLLAAGAVPDLADGDGITPLHKAAGFGASPEAVVHLLLGEGADPNRRDSLGMTPLHWAASVRTSPEAVQALLDAGADPNARDKNGKLPVDLIPEDSPLKDAKVYRDLLEARNR
ncbi:MAG: ankyrin repeat domain-containing protein [Albidovulum sp.]|nr:ankyrin repeat domain-containing protein [Albidovulum sp.]MDE0532545.1 ankyrin repeat domain-containing protein [Albidovulum sp.]